jgi:lambda family phage portal protein
MAVDAIKNLDLRPTKPLSGQAGVHAVQRTSGSRKGPMGKWLVQKVQRFSERQERETISDRSQDVVANDPHAASTIDSMAVNIVGTGLVPQANPCTKALGWTEDQAKDFQDQAELAFELWAKDADVRGRHQFWQIQYLSIYSMLMKGEFFRQPVMADRPHKPFALALQTIDTSRIFTPSDKTGDKRVRDGIVFDTAGAPVSYFIAETDSLYTRASLDSGSFASVPALIGHRPGMLHGFVQKEDEQVRGVPVLSPAMKFIRDLSDYLEFELIGAIVASSFPVFIETTDPLAAAEGFGHRSGDGEERYQEFQPGQVVYGNINEKPHVLKSDRPANSFDSFVERIVRAIGAAVGMPYEVIAKDFSKTNYSSARAALLEAWRVFGFYQKWLVQSLCQPCWDMVLEEAWLRGMIQLPKGSPDWYDARHLYTWATWIPPRKGSVDPVKEITAAILAKDNNIQTLAQIAAENGGDWETIIDQRARETAREKEKGLTPVKTEPAKGPGNQNDENDTPPNNGYKKET